MDNTSNKGTMLQEPARLLQEHNIDFDAVDRRIMCYGHVVDLSTGHVIDALTKKQTDDDKDWTGPPLPSSCAEQIYDKAVACDPIMLLCGSSGHPVRVVTPSMNSLRWVIVKDILTPDSHPRQSS